jgi:hypothetical protein
MAVAPETTRSLIAPGWFQPVRPRGEVQPARQAAAIPSIRRQALIWPRCIIMWPPQ